MLGIDVKVDRSGGIIMNSYAKCAVSNSACRESGRLWKTRHVNLWSSLARADSRRRECIAIVFLMIFMSPAGHMPLRKMIPSWRPLHLFESPESDLDVKSELNRTQSTHRSEGPWRTNSMQLQCSHSSWTNSACSWSQHEQTSHGEKSDVMLTSQLTQILLPPMARLGALLVASFLSNDVVVDRKSSVFCLLH